MLGLGEWAGHFQGEFLYLEMPLQVAFLWHTSLQGSLVHDSLVTFLLMVPPQALHSDLAWVCEGVWELICEVKMGGFCDCERGGVCDCSRDGVCDCAGGKGA